MISRRLFNKKFSQLGVVVVAGSIFSCKNDKKISQEVSLEGEVFFKLSLAQWSLNKSIKAGKLDNLDFAEKAKSLDFEGIEYVNQFFIDKAKDIKYLHEMNVRAQSNGVQQLLIMVDREGSLASTDKKEQERAIENHKKWIDAASTLGCHSLRVNSYGEGDRKDVADAAVFGLSTLSELAAKNNINIIVENHGGYTSDGEWMSSVLQQVNMENCGSLPDFGNFCVKREGGAQWGAPCIDEYDKYKGVKELMPFAKAVSAKSYDFDNEGNETLIDYKRMVKILKSFNYNGFVGIEYEGDNFSEEEGIIKTKELLIRTAQQL